MRCRPRFTVSACLLAATLTLAACSGNASTPASLPTEPNPTSTAVGAASPPPSGVVLRDVTYCDAGGIPLKMDLYFPTAAADSRARPVAMYVHGGGFVSGDKGGGAGAADIPELVRRGYVVASVNYRLAPQYPFPAAIEDVKCAVRFLRASASTYGVDPERIGAWGGSAGGSLVSLLGVTDATAGLEGNGGYLDQSSRVEAVVDMFGPSDLTSSVARSQLKSYLGSGAEAGTNARAASPRTWVSPDDPPFLILQGDKDNVVPPAQSQILYNALRAAGVEASLVMVENAGHGFRPSGGPISPTRQELTKMMADFFDSHLGK